VQNRRWFDPRQPQTLQIATMLLYFHAAFSILDFVFGRFILPLPAVAGGLGAFGMANEKKWGYQLATGAAIVRVLIAFALGGPSENILGFMIAIAVVALLLHPQSRDYQRIWYS
jgi:hypothetical protein